MPSIPLFSLLFRKYKYKYKAFSLVAEVEGGELESLTDEAIVDWLEDRATTLYRATVLQDKAYLDSLHLITDQFDGMLTGFEVEFASAVSHHVFGAALARMLKKSFPKYAWGTIKSGGGYHGAPREKKVWHVERDGSISTNSAYPHAIELVMPPQDFYTSVRLLTLIFAIVAACGRVSRSCGLHFTVSHPKINERYNVLGLLSRFDVAPVLEQFDRTSNMYCKNYTFNSSVLSHEYVQQYATAHTARATTNYGGYIRSSRVDSVLTGTDRTQAINFTKLERSMIELRAMGGKDYHTKFQSVVSAALSFARSVYLSLDSKPESRYHSARKLRRKVGHVTKSRATGETHQFHFIDHIQHTIPAFDYIKDRLNPKYVVELDNECLRASNSSDIIVYITRANSIPQLALTAYGCVIPLAVSLGPTGRLILTVDVPRRDVHFLPFVKCLTWIHVNSSKLTANGSTLDINYTQRCIDYIALGRATNHPNSQYPYRTTTRVNFSNSSMFRRVVSCTAAGVYPYRSINYNWDKFKFDPSQLPEAHRRYLPLSAPDNTHIVANRSHLVRVEPVTSHFADIDNFTVVSSSSLMPIVRCAAYAIERGALPIDLLSELIHRVTLAEARDCARARFVPDSLGTLRALLGMHLRVSVESRSLAVAVALVFTYQVTLCRHFSFQTRAKDQKPLVDALVALYKQAAAITVQMDRSLSCTASIIGVLRIVLNSAHREPIDQDAHEAMTFDLLSVPCVQGDRHLPAEMDLFDLAKTHVTYAVIHNKGSIVDKKTGLLIPKYREFALRKLCGDADLVGTTPGITNIEGVGDLYTALVTEYLTTGDSRVYRAMLSLHRIVDNKGATSALPALNVVRTRFGLRATYYIRCAYGMQCLPTYLPSLILFIRSLFTKYNSRSFWRRANEGAITSDVLGKRSFYLNGSVVPNSRIRDVIALSTMS